MMGIADKRVIVLGAGGFIGTNLARRLHEIGAQVTGFGRSTGALADLPIRFVRGDAHAPEAMAGLFEGQHHAVYLLGTTTPASSNADMAYDVRSNLLVALAALEAAASAGVERFVLISSGGTVYGPDAEVPTPETAPTDPICSYGIVKLAIEKYLRLFETSHGMMGLTLRVANPYGPHQRTGKGQGVIGAFIERTLRGQALQIWGDGSVRRDYVFVDDLVDAILASFAYAGNQRVFNIGSGTSRDLNEVVASLRALDPRVEVHYQPARSVDVPVSQLAIDRAVAELGWRPGTQWQDGIGRTYDWFSSHVSRE